MAYVRASMWHPCGTRGTLKKGCKRPVHRRLGTVAPFFAKNPMIAFISGRNALIFQNRFVTTTFFRNFAIQNGLVFRFAKGNSSVSA